MASPMRVQRLSTGYWRVSWGRQRFMQWEIGKWPKQSVFGFVSDAEYEAAIRAVEAIESASPQAKADQP